MFKTALDAARETELLREIQNGNTAAEQELLTTLRIPARVEMMIKSRLQINQDDLADMVADVLLAILVNLRAGKLDSSKGSVSLYVWGIARNKIRDYVKPGAAARRQTVDLAEVTLLTENYAVEKNEQREILLKGIRQLAPKYQEVIILRYFEDLDVQEIAAKTALTPTQTYSRIHYALDLLRSQLKGMDDDGS